MPRVQFLNERHFTKRTTTDDFETFEVFLPQPRATKTKKLCLFLSVCLTVDVTLRNNIVTIK